MKNRILNSIILLIVLLIICIYLIPKEGFSNYDLSKVIWSYWHSDDMPEQIRQIQQNNKRKLMGWNIVIVTKSNKYKFIEKADDKYANWYTLSHAHYADWMRLYLLKKYGGVWMDASIIINSAKHLNHLWNESVIHNYELTGFNLNALEDKSTEHPVIENWFIMAPRGSEIISLWFEEFEKALDMGFLQYKNNSIKNGVKYQNIFKNGYFDIYLTQHGCLQVVLQKRINRKPRIFYENAVNTMLKIQGECNWKQDCFKEKMLDKSYSKKIPFIKLRSDERVGLDLTSYFKE